ncbi:zinc-ribbon domain-containing protein [uncultured Deefgea sp.]|uniref:YfgJ family double zinc ribbon protein n=1 Tax=uncultured Deefgea sp. TaxID=1304914 RepID=UPI002614C290|nr:zinc-ribbon domain-containing protein [uncultured Deefgea sp.]
MKTNPIIVCPDCGKEIEVLKACGASNFFCNHCNELKSSQRVKAANPLVFPAQPEK